MTKNLKITLFILFVVQVFVACSFELAHDEAYYWLYSKHLDWGYFDHPPMVGLVIKAFSFLPKSEFSVRFGFILLQFLTLFCLFRMIPEDKKFHSALLYFAFPLASFVGLFALPDMPLLFMSALYCLFLKDFLETPKRSTPYLLGLTIVFLLMSKYHGILLVFFTLLATPRLFKQKEFYIVTGIALIGCLPHFFWQYSHDFATLKYHFVDRPSSEFSLKRIAEYLGSQVGLAGIFAGPVIWWYVVKNKTNNDFERALKFISLGTLVFFLFSTFSKKVEANWTVFLTIPLIILVAKTDFWSKKWLRILVYTSFAVVFLARFLLVVTDVGPKRLKEFHGWSRWTSLVTRKCQQLPILANTYQLASKLSFYTELPIHAQNFHSRKNQFDLWPKAPEYYQNNKVCYLTDTKNFKGRGIKLPDGKLLFLGPVNLEVLK